MNASSTPSRSVTLQRRNLQGRGVSRAFSDLIDGFAAWQIWANLGWNDIRTRYRRSMIGPFWITISMAVTVLALGFLYARLFRIDIEAFLPMLALGFILWGFFAPTLNECCTIFVANQNFIKQATIPLTVYVNQAIFRQLITFAHNFIIYFGMVFFLHIPIGWVTLWAIPAFILVTLTIFGAGLFLAVVCARFRDIPNIVQNILQIGFYLSPILWSAELLPERAFFLTWNPFYYLIYVIRMPLLGEAPTPEIWLGTGVITVLCLALGLVSFLLMRRRIAYWV
ncbi:MAG: ABC transporter permease [Alphaproteobacteria bacterium]|nr:ABC transporter permease [Alphaproteobacteria bacterium]